MRIAKKRKTQRIKITVNKQWSLRLFLVQSKIDRMKIYERKKKRYRWISYIYFIKFFFFIFVTDTGPNCLCINTMFLKTKQKQITKKWSKDKNEDESVHEREKKEMLKIVHEIKLN